MEQKETDKKFIPALGYDWLSGFYDLTIKLTMPEKKFRTMLVDKLASGDTETILEFGFGTAANLILAHERNPETVLMGVDIDPKVKAIAVKQLNKKGIDIPLDLYDGITLPYAEHAFDKVFSSLVFHQLDQQNKLACLREIHRVLKPGGKLIIGDWGKAKSRIMRVAFYVVQLLDGFKTTADNVRGFLPVYMQKAGFRNVSETDFINTKIGSFCYYKALK